MPLGASVDRVLDDASTGLLLVPTRGGEFDGDGGGDLGVGWGSYDHGYGAVVVYLGPLSGALNAADGDGTPDILV